MTISALFSATQRCYYLSTVAHPVRLLALDIDGTLVNSRFAISPGDLAALRRAHASGIEVILCTGRRHSFAMPIAIELGFELWICSSNGSVMRSTSGQTFHREFLAKDLASELCTHMAEFRGGTVITFDRPGRGALVIERADELSASISRWLESNAAFIEWVSPIEDSLTTDPLQTMFCGTIARVRQAEAHLASFARVSEINVLKTQYDHRDLSMLDLLPRDCSKGHTLTKWTAEHGIHREQIMAIGDNFNDVEMLAMAGHPFIMGNACAELQQNGWNLTASNDDCGVAAAITKVLDGKNLSLP